MELKEKISTINELPKEIIRKVRINIGEIKRSLVRLKATDKDVVANELKSDVFREYIRGGKGLKVEDCLLTIRTIEKHIEQGFISGTGARTWKSQDFYSFYFEDNVAKWKAFIADLKEGKDAPDSGNAYGKTEHGVNYNALEKQNIYLKRLEQEFGSIKLSVVDFELPIQHFVQLPLLKFDAVLQDQLTSLEQKRSLLVDRDTSDIQLQSINKKIRDVERILEKEHDILDIIGLGNDVFIEAPAGSGKSTLLRWLTYTFALESEEFFPVFIELMYCTSNDLVTIIEERLSDYDLEPAIVKDKKLLLLLDGFDQFTGNKTDLFNAINRIKRKYPAYIVFSGRQAIDKSKHGLDLVVYNLKPFQDKDIKSIMLAYFEDETKTLHYYDYVASRNLTSHLSKPLYLAFFLAYIGKEIEHGIADDIDITTYIVNKGKLLESLIVEHFIKTYEKDDHSDKLDWQRQKTLQIELLSHLAYQMTYQFKGMEVMKMELLEELLEKYCKSDEKYSRQIPSDIITAFLKHSILYHSNGLVSFEKKELRLFFTALYVRDQIKNYKDFLKIKREIIKRTNKNTWDSISNYLIGFIDADLLLSSFKKVDFDAPLVIHQTLVDQYKLALECMHQNNYPIKRSYINEDYLFRLNKWFIEKLLIADDYNKKDYYISFKPLLRDALVTMGLSNNSRLPQSIADNLNRRFFKFVSNGNYTRHKVEHYVNHFERYDFKQPFDGILEIVNPLDEAVFKYKKLFYTDLLLTDQHTHLLTSNDKIAITYHYIFERNEPKYQHLFDYGIYRMWKFNSVVIREHSTDFLNYFFDKKQDILPFTFKRYLVYTKRHLTGGWKFDASLIKSEYLERFVSFFKPHFLNVEHPLSYAFAVYFDDALRTPFLDFFSEAVNGYECTEKQKINAVTYLINGQRKSDLHYLRLMIAEPANPIRKLIIRSLTDYFPDRSQVKEIPYNEDYINLIANSLEHGNLSADSIANILFNIGYTNDKLNNIVLELLTNQTDSYYLTQAVISFVGHFKVIEAATPLEPFLKKDIFKSSTYYALYNIDPQFHFKYASEVKEDYQDLMTILTAITTGRIILLRRHDLFEALYIGDRNTLNTIEKLQGNLQELTLEDVSQSLFYNILESLKSKCRILDKQKPS